MFKFVLQKMINKKWMVLALLIGNILLISITGANAMYGGAVLQRGLTKEMAAHFESSNTYPGLISVEAGILAGGFTSTGGMSAVMALMLLGPANKHCANDNTSGVAAVMELMQRLPQEQRGKAAFILFDNEELGLLGSSAYASKHKAVKKDKLIINMDCVGDGENLLFFANKRTRELPCFPALESAMAEQTGRNFVMNRMEKCVYPSDQASFRHGIAVCACNRAKVIGYYCDKIHTKKDTICEQANLDFLAAGLADFTSRL